LDTVLLTGSNDTDAFGFYDNNKKQAQFYFTTNASNKNDVAVILDFKFGEPVLNEPLPSIESRVRCLKWEIKTPGTNDWFSSIYPITGGFIGITGAAKLYDVESGYNDYANTSIPVESEWNSPHLTLGNTNTLQQWLRFMMQILDQASAGTLAINFYENRNAAADATTTFSQVAASGEIAKPFYRVMLRSETLKIKFAHTTHSKGFDILNASLTYEPGAVEVF